MAVLIKKTGDCNWLRQHYDNKKTWNFIPQQK